MHDVRRVKARPFSSPYAVRPPQRYSNVVVVLFRVDRACCRCLTESLGCLDGFASALP